MSYNAALFAVLKSYYFFDTLTCFIQVYSDLARVDIFFKFVFDLIPNKSDIFFKSLY